eukprot:COSAG02_NODE_4033_length_5881_cov_4.410412_3_plen_432_part_00
MTGLLAAAYTASTRPSGQCEPAVAGDGSGANGQSSTLPDLTLVLGGSEHAYRAFALRNKADLPQSAVLYAVTPVHAPNRSGGLASPANDHTREDAPSGPQTITVAPGGSTTDFILSIPGAGWFRAQAIDPAGHIPPAAALYAVSLESERGDATMCAREEDATVTAPVTEDNVSEQLTSGQAEQERIVTNEGEQVRLVAQKADEARLVAQNAELEQLAAENAEQERFAADKAKVESSAAHKAGQKRSQADQVKQERIAAEDAEQEHIVVEQAEDTDQAQLAVGQARLEHSAALHSEPPPSSTAAPQLAAAEEAEVAAPGADVHSAPPPSSAAAPQLAAAEEAEVAAPGAAVHSAPPPSSAAAPQLAVAAKSPTQAVSSSVSTQPYPLVDAQVGLITAADSSSLTESQKSAFRVVGTGVLFAAVGMCAFVSCR